MPSSPSEAPDYEVAIIGAGFAGLCMAIKLKEAGQRSFVVFEREPEIGGTWLINNYPGCACDIPSHLYSYSFAPNPEWSRAYSPQQEIWSYLRRCANEHELYPYIRLRTSVEQAVYDEARGVWRIATSDGRVVSARTLISGVGGLDTPAYPEIPGRASFEGPSFHSQRWAHDEDLSGKTVAVIGTGASAIQFVPQVAKVAARLHLFQRTAPWILPKRDHAISRATRRLYRRVPALQRLARAAIYASHEWHALMFVFFPALLRGARALAKLHLRREIKDPALRAKLTPTYTMGCKRILMSNDYYPALQRDNVDVVTTGIREIRARSVVTVDGVERFVDAIIYGTGFRAADPMPRGVVFGRGGLDLVDAWADGPEAYKGTTVRGFPNMFMMMGPNTGLGHNSVIHVIESQARYVMDALRTIERRRLKSVEVRERVQRTYNAWIQRRMGKTVWMSGGCVSWYQREGGKNVVLYPGFTFGLRHMLRRFDVGAYELTPRDHVGGAAGSPHS
jgi:cyclohexanone monooxygenase